MDIRSYISNLVEKSIYPTMKMLFSVSSDKIVDAINKKEQKVVNPADISEPIVAQIQALEKTVSESRVESIVVKNIADAKIDLSGLVQAFKDEIAKLDREVVVNQGDVNVDVSSVVKAIEKMEKSIPKMEKQEVIDYTMMFSDMMDIMEKSRPSEDVVEAITKLASQQGKDITLLAEWLKVIAEKEGEDFPSFKFDDDGRLLVNVNIRGGGGGGTSGGGATDVSALATSAKQDILNEVVHAEDTPHVTGDKGVPLWGVRVDAFPPDGGVFGADGDYTPIATNYKGDVKVVPQNTSGASINPATEETLDNLRDNIGQTTDTSPAGPDENGTISAKLRWLNTNQYQMMADLGDLKAETIGMRSDLATYDTNIKSVDGRTVVQQMTMSFASVTSGDVLVPTSGYKLRIYGVQFSSDVDLTAFEIRPGAGGTSFWKQLVAKTGGLYAFNNGDKYKELATDETLYAIINNGGALAGNVQVNVIYTELV